MATITGTEVRVANGVKTWTWTALKKSTDDVGTGVQVGNVRGLCVQLAGTLGSGGAVTMQGSNDGSNWGDLYIGEYLPSNDSEPKIVLDALTELRAVPVLPLYIRPKVTAGDSATSLTVILSGAE